jgi:chromosome partitioning protein
MPAVIAFISQKGGVGKSTLARALAAVCAQARLKVVLADLDPRQQTLVHWQHARTKHRISPRPSVEAFSDAAEAVEQAEDCDLLILDTPGGVNDDTLAVARMAHLIVQPTGPTLDDLHPTVLLFHELVEAGIHPSRLVAALCRVLDDEEDAVVRAFLEEAGYEVLEGSIPESITYRVAHNRGRSLTETDERAFNERADRLIEALLRKVAAIFSAAEIEEQSGIPKGESPPRSGSCVLFIR